MFVQAINGDVLVFLPGWDEISTLKDTLESAASAFSSPHFLVLPLHSQIAPEEQKRVFQVCLCLGIPAREWVLGFCFCVCGNS